MPQGDAHLIGSTFDTETSIIRYWTPGQPSCMVHISDVKQLRKMLKKTSKQLKQTLKEKKKQEKIAQKLAKKFKENSNASN
jgi:hypothetical protein